MIVEVVLLFPLMIAMVFGVLEFGWWVNAHMVTANAASQAARSVALTGRISSATVPDQIEAIAKGGGLDTKELRWTATATTADGGVVTSSGNLPSTATTTQCIYEGPGGFSPGTIKVTVNYTYQLLFPPLGTPMFLDLGNALPKAITATSTVPLEEEWSAGPTC